MKTKIGFQLSSITPYLDTEEHIKDSLSKIAKIGYKYVQLQGVPSQIDNQFLSEELKRNGLVCVATQEDYPFGFGENPEAAIERAVTCGCQYLAFALIPRDVDDTEKLKAFAEKIRIIEEMVQKAGLIFSFHPIGSDYREMDGVPVFERLLALMPDLHLTFCLQSAFGSTTEIADVFKQYEGKMELVHFKDNIILPDGKNQLVPLGEGLHDWKPYYEMCTLHAVEYVFAEQERWTRDAFDCAQTCYDYLLKLRQ